MYLRTELFVRWLVSDGDATMVNMASRSSLPLYKFHSRVHAISFSPDGKSVSSQYRFHSVILTSELALALLCLFSHLICLPRKSMSTILFPQ